MGELSTALLRYERSTGHSAVAQYFPHYRTGAETSFSQTLDVYEIMHQEDIGRGKEKEEIPKSVQIFTSGGIYKPDKVLTALPIKRLS